MRFWNEVACFRWFFFIKKIPKNQHIDFDSVFSIVYKKDCISLICHKGNTSKNEKLIIWKCLKVFGTLDFNISGVLASVLNPLSIAEISVLVTSSFDTDYIFIRANQFDMAVKKLKDEGFEI